MLVSQHCPREPKIVNKRTVSLLQRWKWFAKNGAEPLTHRAVAAVAEVPLGSKSYHFKSHDGLLAAALNGLETQLTPTRRTVR